MKFHCLAQHWSNQLNISHDSTRLIHKVAFCLEKKEHKLQREFDDQSGREEQYVLKDTTDYFQDDNDDDCETIIIIMN